MGDIFDQRGRASTENGHPAQSAGDYDELPHVSRLMVGVWSEHKKNWELPPHTLIMWLEGSIAKFLFTAKNDNPRLFGTTSGLSHGLGGVQTALASGQCEWKPPKGKKGARQP